MSIICIFFLLCKTKENASIKMEIRKKRHIGQRDYFFFSVPCKHCQWTVTGIWEDGNANAMATSAMH